MKRGMLHRGGRGEERKGKERVREERRGRREGKRREKFASF